MIKKRIFRFWMINILMSIVLFAAYRIVIAKSEPADTSWFEKIIYILDLLINLGFSTVYLLVMTAASLAIFLNHIVKINHNFYLSLLTFVAIPLACTICLAVKLLSDFYTHSRSIFSTLTAFSMLYLLGNFVMFLIFRKSMRKLQQNNAAT